MFLKVFKKARLASRTPLVESAIVAAETEFMTNAPKKPILKLLTLALLGPIVTLMTRLGQMAD